MRRIGCPETSITKYQYRLRNIQEELNSPRRTAARLLNIRPIGCPETSVTTNLRCVTSQKGCAIAQVVSRWPSIAEARVRSRVSPFGICGGQSGTETGFPQSTSVFRYQFHSNVVLLLSKMKKLIIFLFIFITGLHNNP
jgi:hypothetical protein